MKPSAFKIQIKVVYNLIHTKYFKNENILLIQMIDKITV